MFYSLLNNGFNDKHNMLKQLHVFIKSKILYLVALLLLLITMQSTSTADETNIDNSLPSFETSYQHWQVFTITQNNGKVCYILSNPVEMVGNHSSIRKPYIMVSLFGANKVEISISADFQMKLNSIVPVSIDGIQERFVAENENFAWVEKRNTDKDIIRYMMNGLKLLVFYESSERTYAVDTYSLKGFFKAYRKAQQLCQQRNIINNDIQENDNNDNNNNNEIADDHYEQLKEENRQKNIKTKKKNNNITNFEKRPMI